MQTALINLRAAAFWRAGHKVFAGTNWCIRAGEHWAVVGVNGSGKSTLLRALWGGWPVCAGTLDYAFERTIAFQRHFYFAAPEEAVVHVGFAEQREFIQHHLNFMQERWYSGAEHEVPTVAEFLSWENIRGIIPFQVDAQPPDASRYIRWRRHAIGLLQVALLLTRRLHLLSNGEWRRVLLARALMQKPLVLLLDDPFADLDADAQTRMRKYLTRLFGERMPVIMAVTQVAQITPGITHVLVVRDSCVVYAGRWPQCRPCVAALLQPKTARWVQLPRRDARRNVTAPAVFQCRGLNITLGGKRIIRDLNWKINKGEQWALLGPNGAGKSTLAGVIAGDVPQAYAADITYAGQPRGAVWQLKHTIGFFAPELLVQFPNDMTAEAAVCSGHFDTLGLYRRCPARVRAQARRWLARLQLANVIRRPLYELSEATQRLVLIARALIKNPQLLILDEPFQNLDEDHRARLRLVLEDLAAHRRMALILITHRSADLPSTITHLLRLESGHARYCGRATRAVCACRRGAGGV